MERKQMETLIRAALRDLDRARGEMQASTFPQTPLPRPRTFVLISRVRGPNYRDCVVVWPYIDHDGQVRWDCIAAVNERGVLYSKYFGNYSVPEELVELAGGQPRQVLKLLRRIQAAAAWCRARRKGRERAAQEILRQQARWAEVLEAEAVLLGLARS